MPSLSSQISHPAFVLSLFFYSFIFFFNDTATTEIYTFPYTTLFRSRSRRMLLGGALRYRVSRIERDRAPRSEEHTSELQSRQYLVCRLLLEKKKKKERRERHRPEYPVARH